MSHRVSRWRRSNRSPRCRCRRRDLCNCTQRAATHEVMRAEPQEAISESSYKAAIAANIRHPPHADRALDRHCHFRLYQITLIGVSLNRCLTEYLRGISFGPISNSDGTGRTHHEAAMAGMVQCGRIAGCKMDRDRSAVLAG